MTIIGTIGYALFVFWICGTSAVFVDIDHIWTILGRVCPIRLSESYGRPFHTRTVFVMVAIIISVIVVTFAHGLYEEILFGFGEIGTVIFFTTLIIITYISTKYLGRQLLHKMVVIRWHWRHNLRKEKINNGT